MTLRTTMALQGQALLAMVLVLSGCLVPDLPPSVDSEAVVIPRLEGESPKIDRIIGEEEYEGALRLDGTFVVAWAGHVQHHPFVAWLTHDAERIYLAAHVSDIPPARTADGTLYSQRLEVYLASAGPEQVGDIYAFHHLREHGSVTDAGSWDGERWTLTRFPPLATVDEAGRPQGEGVVSRGNHTNDTLTWEASWRIGPPTPEDRVDLRPPRTFRLALALAISGDSSGEDAARIGFFPMDADVGAGPPGDDWLRVRLE